MGFSPSSLMPSMLSEGRLDPNGIVVTPDGDLFISDSSTSSILKITFEDEGDE